VSRGLIHRPVPYHVIDPVNFHWVASKRGAAEASSFVDLRTRQSVSGVGILLSCVRIAIGLGSSAAASAGVHSGCSQSPRPDRPFPLDCFDAAGLDRHDSVQTENHNIVLKSNAVYSGRSVRGHSATICHQETVRVRVHAIGDIPQSNSEEIDRSREYGVHQEPFLVRSRPLKQNL
jgi:hypothetical protein